MNSSEAVRLKNSVTEQDHVSGPDNAAVTLLEYGNFECLHCGRVFPVLKQLRRLLENDLRFVFRHFPTVQTHPHSLRAAEAAEAAGAQGKFWQMHDELFANQGALEDRDLMRYARRIGLDGERFAQDMAANTFREQIVADFQRALFDEHVTGTPTIYINDIRYSGATDFEGLLAAIKEADTGNRIHLPETGHRLRGFVDKLRRG